MMNKNERRQSHSIYNKSVSEEKKRCDICAMFEPPEPATKSGVCMVNGYRVGPGNTCDAFKSGNGHDHKEEPETAINRINNGLI